MTLIRDIQFENNPDNREPVETPNIRIPASPEQYTFEPQTTKVAQQAQTPQPAPEADSLTPLRTPVLTQGLPEQNVEAPSDTSAFDILWSRASESAQAAQEWERQRWDANIDPNLYRVDINGAPPTPSFVQETEQYLINALGSLGSIQGFEPRDQVHHPLNDIDPMQNAVSSQQGLVNREGRRRGTSLRELFTRDYDESRGTPGLGNDSTLQSLARLFGRALVQGVARTIYDIPVVNPVEFGRNLVAGVAGQRRPDDMPQRTVGDLLGVGDEETRERVIQQAFQIDSDEATLSILSQLQPDFNGTNTFGDYGSGVIGGANYYMDTWSGGNIIRPFLADSINLITGNATNEGISRMNSAVSILQTPLRVPLQLTGATLLPGVGDYFVGAGGQAARGREYSFTTPAGEGGFGDTPVDLTRTGIRVPQFLVDRFGAPEILFEGQTGTGIMTGFVLDAITELPTDMAWDYLFDSVRGVRQAARAGQSAAVDAAAEAATSTVIPSRALQIMQQDVHHGIDNLTIQPLTPPTVDFSNVPLARLNAGVPEQQLITNRAGRVIREETEQLTLDLGVMGQQTRMLLDERQAIAQIRDGVDRPFVAGNWQGAREPLNVGTVENGTRAQQLMQQQEIDLWNPPDQVAPQAPTTRDLPLRETSQTDIQELSIVTERPMVDVDELSIYDEGNLSMTAWTMEDNRNVLEVGFTVGGEDIRGAAPQIEGGNIRSMIREWRSFANDVQDEYVIVARAGTNDVAEFDMKMRTYQNEGFEFVSQDSWERFMNGEITSHQLEPINPNQAQPTDFMVYRGRNRGGFRRNLQAFGEQRRRLPAPEELDRPIPFSELSIEELLDEPRVDPEATIIQPRSNPDLSDVQNNVLAESGSDPLTAVDPNIADGIYNDGFIRTPDGLYKILPEEDVYGDAYDFAADTAEVRAALDAAEQAGVADLTPRLLDSGYRWQKFEDLEGAMTLRSYMNEFGETPELIQNVNQFVRRILDGRFHHPDFHSANIMVLPDGSLRMIDIGGSYFGGDTWDFVDMPSALRDTLPQRSRLRSDMNQLYHEVQNSRFSVPQPRQYFLGTKAEYPTVPGTVKSYQSARAPHGNGWVLTSLEEAEDFAKAAPANDALIDVPINEVGRVYPVDEVPDRLFDMEDAIDQNVWGKLEDYIEQNFEPSVLDEVLNRKAYSMDDLIQDFDDVMFGLGEDVEVEGQFFRRAIDEALLEEGYNGKRAGNSIITLEPPVLGDGVDVGTGTRLEMLEAQSNIANRMGDPASKVDGARARIEIADILDEKLNEAEVQLSERIAETYRELSDKRTVLEDARNAAEADAMADFMAEMELENERSLYDFDDVDDAWHCL